MTYLWKPASVLICLLLLFLLLGLNLKPTSEPVTGGNCLPSKEEAQRYIEDTQVLTSISEMKKVPIRFISYGPAYLLVTGKDRSGEEKAVWLCKDQSVGVYLIDSVLLKEGVSEAAIREKVTPLAPPGTAPLIFLAPLDDPERPEERFGWYVTFANDETMILSFKTGKPLYEK